MWKRILEPLRKKLKGENGVRLLMMLDIAGQALILITDYVYDTDGRPLHVSKRIQRTDRAKYTEPIG